MGGKRTQRMFFVRSSQTSFPEKQHKLMTDLSNKADFYGPIALEPWKALPMMSVADKRVFWSRRRVAVGG